MPKVLPEYKVQASARIVDAAQTLFRRRGYRAVTMEDIARELGVSKGALYRYFRTKTALLAAIQRRSREQTLAEWERLLTGGDVAEGMADSLREVFAGDIDPGVWLALVAEAATDPVVRRLVRADQRDDLRAMRGFLDRMGRAGRLRPVEDPELVAELIMAQLQASVLDVALLGRPKETRRRLVRSLRYLLPR